MNKYRLICKPNGDLLVDTIELAKDKSLQAIGIAMHILADTWAHSYFAGVPSLVINNTNFQFYEITPEGEIPIEFMHNPINPDDPFLHKYSNSIYQATEYSIMNLGHGRAGHLPDYSFIRYRYIPAWGNYQEIVKDNPADYYKAFGQMVYALKYFRKEILSFEKERYAEDIIEPWKEEIQTILSKRQLIACDDWKAFGKKLSGYEICDMDIRTYKQEYLEASKDEKDDTYLGKFILAALSQKSMVTNRIFSSGNMLAGFSIDYNKSGLKGIRDYFKLVKGASHHE